MCEAFINNFHKRNLTSLFKSVLAAFHHQCQIDWMLFTILCINTLNSIFNSCSITNKIGFVTV